MMIFKFGPLARLVTAALMIAASVGAQADDWANRKTLSLDTTVEGIEIKEELAQFPVLLRLHSGNFKFSEAKPDGSDLRAFAADGKTPLKLHIENWDAANELASVWIKLPKVAPNLKAAAAVIAWGNPNANVEGTAAGTYDADQMFVFHFGASGEVQDVTTNNVAARSTAKPVAAGPIGAAAGFDGKAMIELAAAPILSATKGVTFSAWVKPTGADNGALYEQRDAGKSLLIGLNAGVLFVSSGEAKVAASSALRPGEWQHVVVVVEPNKATLYIDSLPAGSGAVAMPDLGGTATIGAGFIGELDEVTLAATPRSAAYVTALSSSQAPDSAMLVFGEEAAEGGEVNYFAILIGAVTIDGWIVIGLLAVMAVLSFYVMITKAFMLASTSKANQVFLQLYSENSAQLLDPNSQQSKDLVLDESMARSSVYRMYLVGLREVTKRIGNEAESRKALKSAGSDAVRATMDAAMLKESQKFNSGMVLLTISIAGGPFLGLLGTVVGVMITFAAIAAAGDVNVNAIAPGIAAALVATVAGLAVAIPALFGYNWLAAQIKNASQDTQVFLDEFLTRSAELYSE